MIERMSQNEGSTCINSFWGWGGGVGEGEEEIPRFPFSYMCMRSGRRLQGSPLSINKNKSTRFELQHL